MTRLFKPTKLQTGDLEIDSTSGVIRGVSVMTIGPAKGHGINIDRTGLEQCLAACLEHENEGVKLIYVHTGEDSSGEIRDIVGAVKNFRIEGEKLLGDAYLLQSAPSRNFILELAEKMPSEFGLSVETGGDHETVPGSKQKLYRCTDISAIALVPRPAANPTGLFQQKPNKNMDEEQMKTMFGEMLAEALTPINERLSKLEEPKEKEGEELEEGEDKKEELEEGEEKKEDEKKEESQDEKLARLAEKAATEAVTKLAAKFGMKKAPVAIGEGKSEKRMTKFQALVEKHKANGSKSPFAAAIKENEQAYNEHIELMNKGGWN